MSADSPPPSALLDALRARDPAPLRGDEIRELLAAIVRSHGQLSDAGIDVAALGPGHGLAPTDVVRLASALLDAAGLEPFELALWNSFGGLPPKTVDTPEGSRL